MTTVVFWNEHYVSSSLNLVFTCSFLCLLISWLRLEQHVTHVHRQGLSCAGKAYHAKICACVAVCNTMQVCKSTEPRLWSTDIFYFWSAERLGWAAVCLAWIKMQCVDECRVPVWWPWSTCLTHYGEREPGLYIYELVTVVCHGKHGDTLMLSPTIMSKFQTYS